MLFDIDALLVSDILNLKRSSFVVLDMTGIFMFFSDAKVLTHFIFTLLLAKFLYPFIKSTFFLRLWLLLHRFVISFCKKKITVPLNDHLVTPCSLLVRITCSLSLSTKVHLSRVQKKVKPSGTHYFTYSLPHLQHQCEISRCPSILPMPYHLINMHQNFLKVRFFIQSLVPSSKLA